MDIPRVARLKTFAEFTEHLRCLMQEMPCAEEVSSGPDSPMENPLEVNGNRIGNRFSILPMEGWDGTTDGKPTDLTRRRWRNFGISGAKLIWGGEAVAVRHDGRANPNQLLMNEANLGEIEALRNELEAAHADEFGDTSDLLVGLQLTHSGRFARPNREGPSGASYGPT